MYFLNNEEMMKIAVWAYENPDSVFYVKVLIDNNRQY